MKTEDGEYTNEDKELYDQISKIVKNVETAKRITDLCIEWCSEQCNWGGKYDCLFEEMAGDET